MSKPYIILPFNPNRNRKDTSDDTTIQPSAPMEEDSDEEHDTPQTEEPSADYPLNNSNNNTINSNNNNQTIFFISAGDMDKNEIVSLIHSLSPNKQNTKTISQPPPMKVSIEAEKEQITYENTNTNSENTKSINTKTQLISNDHFQSKEINISPDLDDILKNMNYTLNKLIKTPLIHWRQDMFDELNDLAIWNGNIYTICNIYVKMNDKYIDRSTDINILMSISNLFMKEIVDKITYDIERHATNFFPCYLFGNVIDKIIAHFTKWLFNKCNIKYVSSIFIDTFGLIMELMCVKISKNENNNYVNELLKIINDKQLYNKFGIVLNTIINDEQLYNTFDTKHISLIIQTISDIHIITNKPDSYKPKTKKMKSKKRKRNEFNKNQCIEEDLLLTKNKRQKTMPSNGKIQSVKRSNYEKANNKTIKMRNEMIDQLLPTEILNQLNQMKLLKKITKTPHLVHYMVIIK